MLISQENAIQKSLRSRPTCKFEIDSVYLHIKCDEIFTGVQSAAVNVICELARKNPQNYLSLAPLFFKLMTSSSNNWVLIKIIKLVSSLSTCRQPSLLMQRNVEASCDWPVSNLWKIWKKIKNYWSIYELQFKKLVYIFFKF